MSKITKPQLIEGITRIVDLPKGKVAEVVDCLLAQVAVQAHQGADVYLHGFGTFKSKHKPARMGRIPGSDAPVAIEAKQVLVFKAAAAPKGGV